MPDSDDKDHVPFIIKIQGQQDLDRIREFVDNEGTLGLRRQLVVEPGEPDFSADEKEKWLAALTDPAGISLHAFPDRDGKWRGRVTCADGSMLYTKQAHRTAHGLFTWFAETVMFIRMVMPCMCKQCRAARGE
jgi:hypothetical protein